VSSHVVLSYLSEHEFSAIPILSANQTDRKVFAKSVSASTVCLFLGELLSPDEIGLDALCAYASKFFWYELDLYFIAQNMSNFLQCS